MALREAFADLLREKHEKHLPTNQLKLSRHSPLDLAERVKEWSGRRDHNLNPRQRATMGHYRTAQIFSTRNTGNYKEEDILEAYFKLVDDLFFGGTLAAYCKLNLIPTPRFENGGHHKMGDCQKNTTEDFFGYIEKTCCIIRIWTRHDIADHRARRLAQLGTMIHEMIHAYFQIYSCENQVCRDKLEHLGKTGHGFAWQDAAYAIVIAANNMKYLNLPIELSRCSSMVSELRAFNVMKSIDLGRWGMDDRDIKKIRGNSEINVKAHNKRK
jgi:hypothetical protein